MRLSADATDTWTTQHARAALQLRFSLALITHELLCIEIREMVDNRISLKNSFEVARGIVPIHIRLEFKQFSTRLAKHKKRYLYTIFMEDYVRARINDCSSKL